MSQQLTPSGCWRAPLKWEVRCKQKPFRTCLDFWVTPSKLSVTFPSHCSSRSLTLPIPSLRKHRLPPEPAISGETRRFMPPSPLGLSWSCCQLSSGTLGGGESMFNHSGIGNPHRNEGGSEGWGRGLGPLETGGQGRQNEKVAHLFPSNKGLLAGDFPSPGAKRVLRAPPLQSWQSRVPGGPGLEMGER